MNEKLEYGYIVEFDPSNYGDDEDFEKLDAFTTEERAIDYINSKLIECLSDFVEENYAEKEDVINKINWFYRVYRIRQEWPE